MIFKPNAKCNYKFDYPMIFEQIAKKNIDETEMFRELALNDLWFIVYFVFQIPIANEPFIVDACAAVEDGPETDTLDLWAREHFKTTIFSAEDIQKLLKNSETTIGIFSHTRPVAKAILRAIKHTFENNVLLKTCFPDVLWNDPQREAPKWSEDDGIVLKRKSSRREASVEAWGLLEGMPIGKHFDHRHYDDIETDDCVQNPDIVRKLRHRFDLSQNLGVQDSGTQRVIGTFYSHEGLLTYLRDQKDIHGNPVYITRIKPATVDGTPNGKPVLLSQERLDKLKVNEYTFNCQQLLNPTPQGVAKLESDKFIEVDSANIPTGLNKFMIIDPAGEDKDGSGDPWAFGVFAVDPDFDDMGASDIYLIDLVASTFRHEDAIAEIVRMYLRNGMIDSVGVEKIGISTVEIHVANALRNKKRFISQENKSLYLLKPQGRNKQTRIESAIAWPLFNSKLHISTEIHPSYIQRLYSEADKFPYWHDDILDIWSYLYDILRDPKFKFMNRRRWSKPIARPKLGIV